jgi:hypothetical protein
MKKLLTAAVVISSGFVLPGVAGAAPPADPGDFGHHVANCAQEHGFDGEHNPGMHRGRADWDGAAC